MNVACLYFHQDTAVDKVAEIFLRYSPQIALRSREAVFIEIGKCHHLFSAQDFLHEARQVLETYHYHATVQIADQVTSALALARYKTSGIDQLPLEALLDFADPFYRDEGLRHITLQMIDSFQDLGVKNLGAFKKIPVGQLSARFGVVGRFCHLRVQQSDFISWPLWQPAEIILERKEFPYFEFYGELDPILFELKIQIDRLFARLSARQKRVTGLEVRIECERNSAHPNNIRTLRFDFYAPQSMAKGTLKILHERLQREFEKSPILSPIEAVQVKVLKVSDFNESQKNIFNNDEEKFEQLYSIHNQLIELLGKDNIYRAELTQDRRPERAWVPRHDSPHQAPQDSMNLDDFIPERPTYLLRKPIPIEVVAGFIFIQNRKHRIFHWHPEAERIDGAWYENDKQEVPFQLNEDGRKHYGPIADSFHRDYYKITIEKNQKILIFQNQHSKFFLHGYYG